jgi:hypothetical protein
MQKPLPDGKGFCKTLELKFFVWTETSLVFRIGWFSTGWTGFWFLVFLDLLDQWFFVGLGFVFYRYWMVCSHKSKAAKLLLLFTFAEKGSLLG